MVKFSKGMWHDAPNTVIDWAIESWKAEATNSSLRVLATSKAINHRGDTLNCPALTIELTAPQKDILLLKSTHWKARKGVVEGPHYELAANCEENPITVEKKPASLHISTGALTATVNNQPKSFNIDFDAHEKKSKNTKPHRRLLTKLGAKSIGYVRKGTSVHPNDELVDPDKGERWSTFQLQLGVGEKIYGLGERFGPFVKNGQTVELWNEDGGTSSELAYKNVPFYLSSRGYGIFIPTSAFISYEIQSERTTRVNIATPGETISAYIIYGVTPKDVIAKYTHLTGRPPLLPAYSFGLWLSTSFLTNYDEKTVNSFLDGMKERRIPLTVFHYDCFWMKGFQWCDFEFDSDFFPDPAGQIKRLKERGVKVCVWINSYIAQESKLFDEGVEGGYFIKRKDGDVWQWDQWQAGMALVDFTNPEACKWFSSKLQALIDIGVDVFKTDFGERIPTGNVKYYNQNYSVEKMHNYYPFLYNKTVFETLEKHHGQNNTLVFARSATTGGQRFPVHWGGDPLSTYEAMAETLRGGLSLGLCGFGYWAHDIGGFEGTPDPGLFKRWIAFGLLSSHSRLHGSGSFRAPWVIDPTEESSKVLRKFTELKIRLMPYLHYTMKQANDYGTPMMRAMFLEFPDDPTAWVTDTQYMLGEKLLIAPVFNDEGEVEYYIPKGKWRGDKCKDEKEDDIAELEEESYGTWLNILHDFKHTIGSEEGKPRLPARQNGNWVKEIHNFFSIPILLRPGSAIVLGSLDNKGQQSPTFDARSSDCTILVNDTIPVINERVTIQVDSHWEMTITINSLEQRGPNGHTALKIEWSEDDEKRIRSINVFDQKKLPWQWTVLTSGLVSSRQMNGDSSGGNSWLIGAL